MLYKIFTKINLFMQYDLFYLNRIIKDDRMIEIKKMKEKKNRVFWRTCVACTKVIVCDRRTERKNKSCLFQNNKSSPQALLLDPPPLQPLLLDPSLLELLGPSFQIWLFLLCRWPKMTSDTISKIGDNESEVETELWSQTKHSI